MSETWLNDSIHNCQLFDQRYEVFRKDRTSGQSRGGGVLLAARRDRVKQNQRLTFLENDGENLWIKAKINEISVYICIVYIPPASQRITYSDFFDKIIANFKFLVDKKIIIVGDFNLHSCASHKATQKDFLYFMELFQMEQKNLITNVTNRTLDIIISNFGLKVFKSIYSLVSEDSYHPSLCIEFALNVSKAYCRNLLNDDNGNCVKRGWNFEHGDFKTLYCHLQSHDWQPLKDINDVNLATNFFYSTIYKYFDMCFKIKRTPKNGRKYPKWFSSEIVSDIKLKFKHYKKWKKTGMVSERDLFCLLRTKIKRSIRLAHVQYINSIEKNIKCDPKSFWKYISSKRSDGGFVDHVTWNNKSFSGADIPEAFADYFKSTYSKEAADLKSFIPGKNTPLIAQNVDIPNITNIDITAAVKKLKAKTSFGPDLIPSFVLKGCFEPLLTPLAYIYNLSLNSGIFPDLWKISKVTPLHKTGDKASVSNYRPVAILSSPAKLFELIIHKYIYSQVEPFIIDQQHGFRSGRSTVSNLMVFTEYISQALDSNNQVDVSYNDFAKAFDSVDPLILLNKLDQFGFSAKLLYLFLSYFSNRQQYVTYGIFQSSNFITNSGVPQGSNLGPLLFSLFINDIYHCIKFSKFLLFADDIKLFLLIKSLENCLQLQSDINSIVEWSHTNKLRFNIKKCSIMCYTKANKTIYYNYKMSYSSLQHIVISRDLGITFDTHLTFHVHIETICNKALRMLGFVLSNSRHFCSSAAIRVLYYSLVRSILESGSVIWGPVDLTYSQMIEKVQKKFLRYLYLRDFGYYPWLYPSAFLSGMLGINSLADRRKTALLITAYKLLNGNICIPDIIQKFEFYVPDNFTRARRHRTFVVPRCRTNLPLVMPLGKMILLLNYLSPDIDIFQLNIQIFKNAIIT